jgi:hypothetical protein
MGQHDKRNPQQGGGQQEGYSPTGRQYGWNESSRQPQGDFGRGRDHAQLGSSDDDWRRRQDNLGAYRDDESPSPWGGRGSQNQRHGQDNRYSQYGMRDSEQRYDQDSRDQYDRDRQGRFSGGFDDERRSVGYQGGYGGYGYGYGGQQGYDQQQRDQFDPDYSQWRREQMRALDDDYQQWREDRFKKFSDEFSTWRSSRSPQAGGKNEGGTTTPSKSNKDGGNS